MPQEGGETMANPGRIRRARKRPQPAQAPGQLYGFSLQITRALAHLLRCREGDAVSVECVDDVAVASPIGDTLEQDKSGLAHNPVSDRSPDLWKTLHRWVQAIRRGALARDTRFVLHVAQPWDGQLVRSLNDANTREQAAALVRRLRTDLWGAGPRFTKRSLLPDSLAPHVNGVLAASDDVLIRLILSFTLEQGSGRPNDDLRPVLREKAIGEPAIESVLRYLLGWTKREIDSCIERGQAAVLTWTDFRKQLVAAARKFDRAEAVLQPGPIEFSRADVDRELRSRIYVRQLLLVQTAEEGLIRAVSDFLRAATDRTTWSERGDVLEPSFAEFEDRLQRAWENLRKLVQLEMPGRSEEQLGQALLARCTELQARLQGMEVPSHFVPGSYHALADDLAVGWHPRFGTLLAGTAPTGQDSTESEAGASSRVGRRGGK